MKPRFVTDRLWPVLLALVGLLAGASSLEAVAARRTARARVVVIRATDAPGVADDEPSDADEGPSLDEAPPLDAEHGRARLLARRGERTDALEILRRLAAAHPELASIHAELGYWLLVARKPEQALVELETASRLGPRDARSALNLGVARVRTGDTAGAEREYRRALALRPQYGAARVALATALTRRGAHAEAIRLLDTATRTGGNEERARTLVALGRAQLAAGRRQDAGAAFDAAIERAPAEAELRVRIARAWLGGGQRDDVRRALAVLERTIELSPDLPQAYSALARARELAGDAAGAEEAYDRAVHLDPGYRYARRRLIRIALERRDFGRARMHADRLLADAPEDPEHAFLAGLVAARDGRTEDARTHYRDAISKARENYPEAFLNLGVLEKGSGALPAAIAAYERAIALRPSYKQAHNNLGVAYAAAGRLADAEASYRRALAIDPSYGAAWLNLGEQLASSGRGVEAIAALRRALAARPGHVETTVQLARALADSGRADEGQRALRSLLTSAPRQVPVWRELGALEARAGRSAEALDALRRGLEVDPDDRETLRQLGALELTLGHVPQARAAYGELLERDSTDTAARVALAETLLRAGDKPGCRRELAVALGGTAPAGDAAALVARCSDTNVAAP
jgi:tetratricopeptide (TPR) repeat protein